MLCACIQNSESAVEPSLTSDVNADYSSMSGNLPYKATRFFVYFDKTKELKLVVHKDVVEN